LWRHAHGCTASASPLRSPVAILINEVAGGDTMKLRIPIVAVCAATFALVWAVPAQAAYSGAPEAKSAVRITNVGSEPAIRLAALISTSRSNIKHGTEAAPKTGNGNNQCNACAGKKILPGRICGC
jgi:hypothetical protein